MSGTTEKPLADLTVVSSTSGLRILGFSPTGAPVGVEPAAFAAAPTGDVGLSDAPAVALGATGLAGTATTAARADHRHPYPTAANVGAAAAVHTHAIADVTGLQAGLDAKAASSHTHAISGVNGLQAALDGKAASAHTHAIGDVSGLQPALDAKQATSQKGLANGYAGLDSSGKVPAAQLPPASTGVTNVNNGTIDGQVPVWNNATTKYDPKTPTPITADRDPTLNRNSATVLSFAEYNRRNIVLTGLASLSLASAEIGTSPNQGMTFIVYNRHTAINTITFGAGITVDAYPAGTGTGGAVKIAANGGLIAVSVMPVGTALYAVVRGQIV